MGAAASFTLYRYAGETAMAFGVLLVSPEYRGRSVPRSINTATYVAGVSKQ